MDSAKLQISEADKAIEFLGLTQELAEYKVAKPRCTFWLEFEQVRPLIADRLNGWVMILWTGADAPSYLEADEIAEYCIAKCEDDCFYFPIQARIMNFYLGTKIQAIEEWLTIIEALQWFVRNCPHDDVQFWHPSMEKACPNPVN